MLIKVLNVEEYIKNNKLQEITSPNIFTQKNIYDVNGLHSTSIYDTDKKKKTLLTYITLETEFIHPTFLFLVKNHHKHLYRAFLELEEVEYVNGEFKESKNGLKGIQLLKELYSIKPTTLHKSVSTILFNTPMSLLILNKVLVLPPAFRPISLDPDGTPIISDLDQKYINLFVHKRSPFYVVQPLMQELVTEILTMLKGKEGLFRSTLLSKRLDFSARLVITVDPTLSIDYVKVPYRVLAMIFAPFLIHFLLHPTNIISNYVEKNNLRLPTSDVEAFTLIKTYYKRIIKKDFEELIKLLIDIIVKDKVILAKRDPVLHRGGIQAFYPIGSFNNISDIFTMSISPFVCSPFNADFDGDTMAIYVPLTIEGQEEAKKLLPSNNRFSLSTHNNVFFNVSQDILLACYLLTNPDLSKYNIFKKEGTIPTLVYPSKQNWEELVNKYGTDWSQSVYVKFTSSNVIRSTWGRYILSVLTNSPHIYITTTIKKQTINNWLHDIYTYLNSDQLNNFTSKIGMLVNLVLKITPISLSITDFQLPDSILIPLQKVTTPIEFESTLEKVMENLKKYIAVSYPNLYILLDSGMRGSWKDIQQLMVARGFISKPTGEINLKPILNNYITGLNAEDIYNSASGWRKGIIDKSLGTADAGYLARKIIYIMSPIKLGSKDCRTNTGLSFIVTQELVNSLIGRTLINSNTIINKNNVNLLIDKRITLRSPMYCKDISGNICEVCYGSLVNFHKSKEIGLLSAHALGEKSIQLVLRTFHTGGIAIFTNQKITLPSFFTQEENMLITNINFHITLFIDNENTRITSNGILVYPQRLSLKLDNMEKEFEWELNIPLRIHTKVIKDVSTKHITLYFEKNDIVGEFMSSQKDITSLVKGVNDLLTSYSGTNTQFVFDLFNIYKNVAYLPLIHFELLTSALTWSSDDINVQWRYRQQSKPIVVSYIKAIELQSALLSIMFANPGKGLEHMLTSSKKTDSVLESLIE